MPNDGHCKWEVAREPGVKEYKLSLRQEKFFEHKLNDAIFS